MKIILIVIGILSPVVHAHEGHHEQKTSISGKYGGLLAPVTHADESWKGATSDVATVELVRASDGTVRMYLYTVDKKKSDVKKLNPKAVASLVTMNKGKSNFLSFDVILTEGVYIGKMPKPDKKPYDLQVVFKQENKPITTEFHDLD